MVEILTSTISVTPRSEHRKAEREAVASLVTRYFGTGATLEHTHDGAPYVHCFDGYISVSHCVDLCVLAVSSEPVGVDIDIPRRQLMRVAPRFLTHREQADIDARGEMTDERRIDLLLHYWTAKEAVFKCAAIPDLVISEIEVVLDENFERARASVRGHRFAVMYSSPSPDHLLALSTRTKVSLK